jgi:hypothetical protein
VDSLQFGKASNDYQKIILSEEITLYETIIMESIFGDELPRFIPRVHIFESWGFAMFSYAFIILWINFLIPDFHFLQGSISKGSFFTWKLLCHILFYDLPMNQTEAYWQCC